MKSWAIPAINLQRIIGSPPTMTRHDTYLVIGNPHATLTAEVDVYIGGVKKNNTPYSIAPGQRIFPVTPSTMDPCML